MAIDFPSNTRTWSRTGERTGERTKERTFFGGGGPGPGVDCFLLLEDDSKILLESSDKLLKEAC